MVNCLGPKDVAKVLGIGERQATRLMKTEIESFRTGRKQWRCTELHLEAFIQRRLSEERRRRMKAIEKVA